MATIRDVAQKAGVSPGAVSRILNNDPTLSVSSETRQKVFDAAKQLHYHAKTNKDKSLFYTSFLFWFSK